MLNYTNAIPCYKNIVTYRVTWIILGTFVFISGYFIGKKNIELKKQSLINFYTNRVLRIYPLYLVSIITFTVLGLSDFETSLKAALMLSMFLKPAPPTLWFITMLMLFYILSPFLIVACQKLKMIKIIISYLIIAFILLSYFYFTQLLDVRILMYLPAFVFGLLVANKKISFVENKVYLLSALVLGILISFITNTSYIALNWLLATLMVTILPFFLFLIFKNVSMPSRIDINMILNLSYSSYCMYLFHRPVYILFKKLYFPESDAIQLLYLVAFCLPYIALFSYIVQKSYDAIVQALSIKFSESKKPERRLIGCFKQRPIYSSVK
jgi:peptidoglycan/LPS O-acetylase OafA/YrhL